MKEKQENEAIAAPEKMLYTGETKDTPLQVFAASTREIVAAPLFLLLGLCYVQIFAEENINLWLCLFTAAFLLLTEFLCRGKRFRAESALWLAGILVPLFGILLERTAVWEEIHSLLFMHGFAIWYAASRQDILLQQYTGKFLPADAINAAVIVPFKNIFMKIRVLWYGLSCIGRNEKTEKKPKKDTLVWSVLAVLLALVLFSKALELLISADSGFAELMQDVAGWFRLEWSGELLLRLFFAVPISAYLFGLIAGGGREEREKLDRDARRFEASAAGLRRVPGAVWNAVLAAFLLLYAVFFILQLSYFLGGFTGRVPKDTLVSTYAREGFFELCKVLTVNFTLLWLVTRLCRKPVRESRPTRYLCGGLLAEGLLLAAVAFSKLLLYMNRYGLTAKRLQASWLVTVLAAGCIAALITLFCGRKSFRVFLYFAVLSLLAMYLF